MRGDEQVRRTAAILQADPRVLFAYLFGSVARGSATERSDVDVAVYVDRGSGPLARVQFDLAGALIDGLKCDAIDVVLLNDAPLSLAGRIQQHAHVLVDKDPGRRIGYESATRRTFADFHVREKAILFERYGIGR